MSIHAVLHHETTYKYDRRVTLSPQIIRLRPAPHGRTQVLSYSIKVEPEGHFLNWQQDAFANWQARVVFPDKVTEFKVTVDLVADMSIYNPFDFFVEEKAETFPFTYSDELKEDLKPYLRHGSATPRLAEFVRSIPKEKIRTIDFIVALNWPDSGSGALPDSSGTGRADAGRHADPGLRLLPRFGLAAGAGVPPVGSGGALRVRLPDPADAGT